MTKSIGDYILNFILNEFCKSKVIEWILHVDKTFGPHRYDMIIGHDLMSQLRIILNFDGQAVPWDRLCIDLIGPYETKSKTAAASSLGRISMICVSMITESREK